jgi:ElaB/YqjD/DUF883 family membrane-anchored ribosome-binding protein
LHRRSPSKKENDHARYKRFNSTRVFGDAYVAAAIKDSLHHVLSEAQTLIDTMGEEGAEKYRTAITRLDGTIRRAREDLSDYQASLIRRTRRAARAANDMAHDHPWHTAGAAFAAGAATGALVAILLTRR